MHIRHALAMFCCLAAMARQAPLPPVPPPSIPFQPQGYVCQRTPQPIQVDGKLEEAAWAKASWTEAFVDIEGAHKPKPMYRTRAKFLWDDQHLYIAAELEEPHVWATITQRDGMVLFDHAFEVFLDPEGRTSPYYEFQMNALAAVWDVLLLRPYREGGRVAIYGWDCPGLRAAVSVQGTLNRFDDVDRGWTVEVAIPFDSVAGGGGRPSTPHPGDRWRLNLSRVAWPMEVRDGQPMKRKGPDGKPLPEAYWVWSPQGLVNLHYPEMWGFLAFSDRPAGTLEDAFSLLPEDHVRWALRRVYYAQRAHLAAHGKPAAGLQALGLNGLALPQGWTLHLEAGACSWYAEARGSHRVGIDAQGMIR